MSLGEWTECPPLVSAVLTTRDRPRFLSQALKCFRHSLYPNRELIVVDDGEVYPVDKTAVETEGGRLIRVAPGTSIGEKLNRGLEFARGQWCQKMDDDDWYGPSYLSLMMQAMAAHRETVCRPAVA